MVNEVDYVYVVIQAHQGGKNVTLVYDKGQWRRNDEIDGGEWRDVPPPEVERYLRSLLTEKPE